MPKLTIPSLYQKSLAAHPEREALVFPEIRLSYHQLDQRVRIFARALMALGVGSGDTVGILMPNSADNVACFLASTSIGALCIPINSRFKARELGHVINDSGMKVLLTSDIVAEFVDFAERLNEALPELAATDPNSKLAIASAPNLHYLVMLGESHLAGMLDEGFFVATGSAIDDGQLNERIASVVPDMPAMMLYTSGTTAMPKGCPISHHQIISVSLNIAERFGIRQGDRVWNALPLFHASSILPMLATFSENATFCSLMHFSPEKALRQLESENINLAWPAYNTIWQPILTHPEFSAEKLPQLRGLLCVGPPESLAVMEKSFPQAKIQSCYGITECSGLPIMPWYSDSAEVRYGTCGLPMDGVVVEIRDPETREPLPAGQRGALWLRGDYVIKGYWKDPVKTAECFDENGWFNTGDMGSVNAEGYVYFHGRLKDTLKVGGENVAAVEVEAFLTTHPAVKLAAVVGVPDAKYGEVPAAFVEFRPGMSATEAELIEFCQKGLSGFKVPRFVRAVSEWPMSATKIKKVDLQAALIRELGMAQS